MGTNCIDYEIDVIFSHSVLGENHINSVEIVSS